MMRKQYVWLLPLVLICLIACKGKKVPGTEGTMDINDFITLFPGLKLPVKIADTSLARKAQDSTLIQPAVVSQFIPDSVWGHEFNNEVPKIYPLGKVTEKGKETYLFLRAQQGSRKVAYVALLDKNKQFVQALPLVRVGIDNFTSAFGQLDAKYQLTVFRERKSVGGETSFRRNVYIFNSASNQFMLILTEPNEEVAEHIQNPIDTFSATGKFAGEYVKDDHNFISVRDGARPNELRFFVHFEKDEGSCKGELKGVARTVSATRAVYEGNPCTIEFNFTNTGIRMKEQQGCGAYRDIKCFFEGTYPKKKGKKKK